VLSHSESNTYRIRRESTHRNPGGALGSPLAGAPAFQGNIRARYELAFNGYARFTQIDAVNQSTLPR
jgi:hypothetical protein